MSKHCPACDDEEFCPGIKPVGRLTVEDRYDGYGHVRLMDALTLPPGEYLIVKKGAVDA